MTRGRGWLKVAGVVLLVIGGGIAVLIWLLAQVFASPPPAPLQASVSRYPATRQPQQLSRTAVTSTGLEVPAAIQGETLALELSAWCSASTPTARVDGAVLPASAWEEVGTGVPGTDRIAGFHRWFLTVPTAQSGEHTATIQFRAAPRCAALDRTLATPYVVLPRRIQSARLHILDISRDTLRARLDVYAEQAGPYRLWLGFRVTDNHTIPVSFEMSLRRGSQTLSVSATPRQVGINGAVPQSPPVLVHAELRPSDVSTAEAHSFTAVRIPFE